MRTKPAIFKFDSSLKGFMLEAFGKTVQNGLVVDKRTGKPVRTEDGHWVKEKEFAGFRKGPTVDSPIPITNNIIDLIRLSDYLEGRDGPST